MPRIHYLPDNKTVATDLKETILQATFRSGIPHTHVCGGNASCSTCRVLMIESIEHCALLNAKEHQMALQLHFSPDIQLACQTLITGDVELQRLVLDADDMNLTDQLNRNQLNIWLARKGVLQFCLLIYAALQHLPRNFLRTTLSAPRIATFTAWSRLFESIAAMLIITWAMDYSQYLGLKLLRRHHLMKCWQG